MINIPIYLVWDVRKVVGGFGKKSCVGTGVRKPGNTCVTDRLDMTLAVKVALNPQYNNNNYLVWVPWVRNGTTFLSDKRYFEIQI